MFDSIPEDFEKSYPCPYSPQCDGEVTFEPVTKRWGCSKCQFTAAAEEQGMAALQSGEAPSQHGQPAICAEWVSNSRCAFFSNIYCLRDKACVDTRKQQA